MSNSKRYYAIAINAEGESAEICRIAQPFETLARTEYWRTSTDARWFADGYHEAPKLAIETREKRNGKWVTINTKTFARD